MGTLNQFPPAEPGAAGCRPPLLVILVLLGGTLAALVMGLRLFGVLSAMIFLPEPPVPAQVRQMDAESTGYGVNLWRYYTDASPCEVIAFYEARGILCQLAENRCDGMVYNSPGHSLPELGLCTSTRPYSIFGLRWTVSITARYNRDATIPDTTEFSVKREVLWGGVPPMHTPSGLQP